MFPIENKAFKQPFFSDMQPTTKGKKIFTYKTYSNWPFDTYTDVIELDYKTTK